MIRFRLWLLAALLALVAVPAAQAQTILNSTTTTAAIDDRAQVLPLTAVTNISAGSRNLAGDVVWFYDGTAEAAQVNAVDTTAKTVTLRRGTDGTRTFAHASGVTVFTGPRQRFSFNQHWGSCTAGNIDFLPKINLNTGDVFDCVGVTGQFIQVNRPGVPMLGLATVASATTIAVAGTYTKVSGTTNIATITLPNGWQAGMCIQLEPTGLWSTTTAGNILLATTGVVSKVLYECWNGAKWVPSY
jgi:hypothetical protein